MPQRLLRPSIRQSKRWNRLPYIAQTLYIRLLTLVDDFGRYDADAELIRSEAFPFGDPEGKPIPVPTIDSSLRTFVSKDMLVLYEFEGHRYLQLTRWQERPRSESRWPDPKKGVLLTFDNNCTQMFASSSPPSPSSPPSSSPSRTSGPVGDVGKGGNPENGIGKAHSPQARVLIHFLNEKTGRHFRETEANLKLIDARLNESGVTLEDCKVMIERQCKRWKGTPQEEYLRPETLFGKTKFDGYYAARDLAVPGTNPRNAGTIQPTTDFAAASRKIIERQDRLRDPDANGDRPVAG